MTTQSVSDFAAGVNRLIDSRISKQMADFKATLNLESQIDEVLEKKLNLAIKNQFDALKQELFTSLSTMFYTSLIENNTENKEPSNPPETKDTPKLMVHDNKNEESVESDSDINYVNEVSGDSPSFNYFERDPQKLQMFKTLSPIVQNFMKRGKALSKNVFVFSELSKVCASFRTKDVTDVLEYLYPNFVKKKSLQGTTYKVLYFDRTYYNNMLSKIEGMNDLIIREFFKGKTNYLGVARQRVIKELFGLTDFKIKEVYTTMSNRLARVNETSLYVHKALDPYHDKNKMTLVMRLEEHSKKQY